MRNKKTFPISNTKEFTQKSLFWAETNRQFCYLNGNDSPYAYNSFPEILAVGNEKSIDLPPQDPYSVLDQIVDTQDWQFGFFGYDLNANPTKNDNIAKGHFFCPETILFFSENSIEIHSKQSADDIFESIVQTKTEGILGRENPIFEAQLNQSEYIEKIEKLKQHINRGDIYQLNFCIDFEAQNATINPIEVYQKLNTQSPMPFSGLLKYDDSYIICASPERYIKRIGHKIISQPMKGTAPRDSDSFIDQKNALELSTSTKERAENIMIVDLVRNDLSHFCKSGTVEVEQLCEIYSFQPVHQMVSTVSGLLEENIHLNQILKDTFPMGSMTGAPKIRAMELIEQYESKNRGPFSGSLGYIEPNGNFDFNVLIRSIFYDMKAKTVAYSVGSGITSLSDPESEYAECTLKASSIQRVLSN